MDQLENLLMGPWIPPTGCVKTASTKSQVAHMPTAEVHTRAPNSRCTGMPVNPRAQLTIDSCAVQAAYSTHSICSRQAYTGIRRVFAHTRVLLESGTRSDSAVHIWICTWCVAGTWQPLALRHCCREPNGPHAGQLAKSKQAAPCASHAPGARLSKAEVREQPCLLMEGAPAAV